MNPQLLSLVRSILKIIGALLAGYGVKNAAAVLNTEAMAEMVAGAVVAAIGAYSSWRASSTTSIQQKAADSLPAGTVLPATTDESPKAMVVAPETATAIIRKTLTPAQSQNPTPQP